MFNPHFMNKRRLTKAAFFLAIGAMGTAMIITPACDGGGSDAKTEEQPAAEESEATMEKPPASELAFRNAVGDPPPGWAGPVFELSHNYPTSLPEGNPQEMFPWLQMDVDFDSDEVQWNAQWEEYIQSIKDYVGQGQDPNLPNALGFQTNIGGNTMWYHIPWMAYDPKTGREFTHGTTNERTAHISDFVGSGLMHGVNSIAGATSEEAGFETWAVGCYNDFGGYAVGQAWGQSGTPNYTTEGGQVEVKGLPFPEGTVVVKVLFTTATPEDVPYLEGSAQWEVNRHVQLSPSKYSCERAVAPVYLVQMDVAVVDHRSPTNWVFGTFAYNGTIDAGTVWDRMVPVGLQWGMDGQSWPAVPKENEMPIHESVLAPINIYEHDGCYKRLAGPVDNKQSSCMSCHGGAFVPPNGQIGTMGTNIPPIFGFPTLCKEVDEANSAYFTTYKWPEKYPSGQYNDALNLDFSLQMWVAFLQYANWNVNGQPDPCTD